MNQLFLKSTLSGFTVLIFSTLLSAQSVFAPLNADYYHLIDRYEIKSGKVSNQIFTAVKPYKRSDIVDFIDSLSSFQVFESAADQFNRSYLHIDSWEWSNSPESDSKRPVLKRLFRKKSDFLHYQDEDFDIHVNPVMHIGLGQDSRADERLFINTRGAEIRGMVDKRVGFYTFLAENQMMLPSHVQDYSLQYRAIPHEGFWKRYKDGNGVDFFHARGYLTFKATRHIDLQFGHDRQFIGNGYRSLIFSDFAPPSLFLKGNVKIWKLNYLFVVNQMTADLKISGNSLSGVGGFPQKYNALHHLSLNIGNRLNIGLFESVMFGADSASRFRLDYLNPVIFYRAIEQQNGSSDNVLLGMDFKWNAVKKLSFYGQFIIDEFVIDDIRAGNGWWGNKFGVQAGGKYIDAFGIANLDLQGEINVVRPYTYSHGSAYGSYSSYRQPIAHPLGANFKEIVGIVRYQPIPKLSFTGKLAVMEIGRDSTQRNWGSEILKLNTTRQQDYGNTIGQGVKNRIVMGVAILSFQLTHNLFIDGNLMLRSSESDLKRYDNNSIVTSFGVRWNIPQRLYEF